ncbi:MAG: AsmA family protein [Candidatus Omnitrophica bacterium]|nr:AsmA family protein [Candidatus Omnitrophota bacterium]
MKKLLLILAAIVLLIVVGVGIFIATFDADRYRPQLVSQLEKAIGKPVKLERISLGWRGGVAVQLRGLAIYEDQAALHEPLIAIDSASAVVRLLPLLHKDVQISSVLLDHPHIHVSRDAQGVVTLTGLEAAASPAAASGQQAKVGKSAITFNIGSLKIASGTLHWTDAMASPPTDLSVQQVDVLLKNISLTQPIDIQARAALFSDEQNVRLVGRLQLPTTTHPAALDAVRLETDLSRLGAEKAASSLPSWQTLGLKSAPTGKLLVTIDHCVLDASGLAKLEVAIHLTDAKLAPAQLGGPIEHLTVEALAKPGHIDLTRGTADVAGGSITTTGTIDHLDTTPQMALQINLKELKLESLLPTPESNEPHLRGTLSGSFQGTGRGIAWPQLSQTLSGTGRLTLKDGAIVNLNILREVFQKLSIIPGVMKKLEARLPPEYQAKFQANNTVFLPIDAPMRVEGGALRFEQLPIGTDAFRLNGTGSIGFDGSLAMQWMLSIEPVLSDALIKSVKELQYLANTSGELEMPLVIQGQAPRVAVLPDLNYVSSRLIVPAAEDLLSKFLEKSLKKNAPSEPVPQPQ